MRRNYLIASMVLLVVSMSTPINTHAETISAVEVEVSGECARDVKKNKIDNAVKHAVCSVRKNSGTRYEFNQYEFEMICKIVESEAGNQDFTGRRLVAAVVFNRRSDPRFPNTIEGVIFQKGQFAVVRNGMYARAVPSELTRQAVLAEYQESINTGVVYFSRGKQKYAKNHFKWMDHWFGY